jgi:NAD(P)-dependent dehydrogenase (short-subunit alcohol dehydrogenase family)
MTRPFEGEAVLVTGASKGIGAHLVEHFRARGAWVAASMNHSLLTPAQAIRDAVELNCIAAYVGTREAAKLMRKAHYGRVINLTTIAVPMLSEGELSSAASAGCM